MSFIGPNIEFKFYSYQVRGNNIEIEGSEDLIVNIYDQVNR